MKTSIKYIVAIFAMALTFVSCSNDDETAVNELDGITKFKEITNCPILVNTSFNVRGEPIVCSPSDAFNCFMGTGLDILVIENFILFKTEQDPALKTEYREKYQLD